MASSSDASSPFPAASGRCFSQRAHSIGVSVSETKAEIRIEIARVSANSRNSTPTTPLMNTSGISTASSEIVSERMVKAICREPLSAAASGFSPFSM